MKYLYAIIGLLSLLSSPFLCQAQNWEPFPYDSVYFINEDNDMDILVPVVKSNHPNDLLTRMYTRWEQGFIKRSVTDLDLNTYNASDSIGAHWFGNNLTYNNGELSFETVFSNQIFTVDLQAEVGIIDSFSFTMDNNQFYLLIETESQSFDMNLNDSVKTITLTLTDSLFVPKTFAFSPTDTSENCTDINMFDLGYTSLNKSIIIGKTTGIQEIPNLVYYPFCRSFTKYKTVNEVRTILLDNHFEVGDVIEGTYRYFTTGSPQGYFNFDFKRVITSFNHDTLNDLYTYTADYTMKRDPNTIDEMIIHDPNENIVIGLVSNDIYTGIHENGIGRMLRMNSKWGYPLFQMTHLQPIPSGGLIYAVLGYMEYLTHGDVSLPVLPAETSNDKNFVECFTYINAGGVVFGDPGILSVPEAEEMNPFQVAFNNGVLAFNKSIKGDIDIYCITGKHVGHYTLEEEINNFKLPNTITHGVYLIRFETINEVVKVVH